jgi:hypothetical protein
VSKKAWPLVATTTVAVGMYLLYVHAKQRGLSRAAEGGTEDAQPNTSIWKG